MDHALVAVIIAVVSVGSAKVAGEAVRTGAVSHADTSGSATIFVSITRVIVTAIGALVLLDSLGIAITPLLTALGVGGLAVALALQDTLSNLFAGIHILASHKEVEGAVENHQTTVRFTDFGNSSVNFNVGLRAAGVATQAIKIPYRSAARSASRRRQFLYPH